MEPKKTKTKLPFSEYKDKAGNKLICTRLKNKFVRVTLDLVEERREAEKNHERYDVRNLGTIDPFEKVLRVRRRRADHLFRKANAYGFNAQLLKDATTFDRVELQDEHDAWSVPVAFVLAHGSFLDFKNNGGFETQLFVTLDQLAAFKLQNQIKF